MKPILRITLWIIGILAILLIAGLFYGRYWLNEKLPQLIADKNDSPYAITYKKIDIDFFDKKAHINEAIIIRKAATKDSSDTEGIFAKVSSIDIEGIGIWNLIFHNQINADELRISKPDITLYKGQKKPSKKPRNLRNEVVEPFKKMISAKSIYIHEGQARIIDVRNKKNTLWLDNFDITLKGIQVDSTTLKRTIPFNFSEYGFKCARFYYKTKGFYHIDASNISLDMQHFNMEDFAFLCDTTRAVFDQNLTTEKDLYNIKSKAIAIRNLSWRFNDSLGYFIKMDTLLLDKLQANIYRNKLIADDLKKKKLYSELLRELPFGLEIETFQIKNGLVEYEEKASERGPGKLKFDKFYLTGKKIYSQKGHSKLDDVVLQINTQFMSVSPLKVIWNFNPMNKSEAFRIRGSIDKFPIERLRGFMKPYLNFEGSGELKKVLFDYRGNDNGANGSFAVAFDDLHFKAFQKSNPHKKSKFKTALANLLVKNKSEDLEKTTEIVVERDQTKSFFNLFWKCMQEGLKQTLLVI